MHIQKFSNLWHVVGSHLRDEMYKDEYDMINNLTMIDLSIIQEIQNNPDIIFKDLTCLLNIPKSTLTSAIKRLEKNDYVTRVQSLEDGRQYHLNLTNKGQKAQEQHLKTEYVIFDKLLSSLSTKEQEQFIDLFNQAILKGELNNENN